MQLTASPRPPFQTPLPYLVAVAALLVATGGARSAEGADSSDTDQTSTARDESTPNRKKAEDKAPLEDTSTKHAALEFAGYSDSDHVSVVTPSMTAGIDNVSGASLNASYLVDIVSAASA
ncbi:MAG TPA: hypothetical protein VIJ22_10820, partial [Polyangiaceae bacterium]